MDLKKYDLINNSTEMFQANYKTTFHKQHLIIRTDNLMFSESKCGD
jgi:hypothetical protein